MAIHVRLRTPQKERIRRRIVKMRLMSILSAIALLLIVAAILYSRSLFVGENAPLRFISYVPPEEPEVIIPPEKSQALPSRSGSVGAAAIQPEIIVSTSAEYSIETFSLPTFDMGMSSLELDGIGTALLSSGLGSGLGDGLGGGMEDALEDGGRASGGRDHGDGGGHSTKLGMNDDIQVVIVLDASGSMDSLFQEVADSLEYLMKTLQTCKINGRPAKVNLGIVSYGQQADNGSPKIVSPFSRNASKMLQKVKNVKCDGSNEPCGEAIEFTIKNFPWNMRVRDNILKVVFIAGNEPFDQGNIDYREAIRKARAHGVLVNTIYCGEEESSVTKEWKDGAQRSGGAFFTINIGNNYQPVPQKTIREAIKKLWDSEVIPFGSFADRERALAELKKRPALPSVATVDKWLIRNRKSLDAKYEWDAVDLCIALGDSFTLEMVGGMGNLPESLQADGAEAALQHIKNAASRRSTLRSDLRCILRKGGFCDAAMQALSTQAERKGINMEY